MVMISFIKNILNKQDKEYDEVYDFFVNTKPSEQERVYNKALQAAQEEQLAIIKRAGEVK
jgi:hypothetical protein